VAVDGRDLREASCPMGVSFYLLRLAYYSDSFSCCQKERMSLGRRCMRCSARRPKKPGSVKSSGQKLGRA
jgi:hypothetical protein